MINYLDLYLEMYEAFFFKLAKVNVTKKSTKIECETYRMLELERVWPFVSLRKTEITQLGDHWTSLSHDQSVIWIPTCLGRASFALAVKQTDFKGLLYVSNKKKKREKDN